MSKLDKLKEIINTLRGLFAVLVAFFMGTVSGLINRYDNQKIDALFFFEIFSIVVLIFLMALVVKRIIKRTQEMEDI